MAIPTRYQQIDFVPPQAVRLAAARGLTLRKEFKRGGTTLSRAAKVAHLPSATFSQKAQKLNLRLDRWSLF